MSAKRENDCEELSKTARLRRAAGGAPAVPANHLTRFRPAPHQDFSLTLLLPCCDVTIRLRFAWLTDRKRGRPLDPMIVQQNISQSFHSPIVLILLAAIACGLLYVLWREVRKIPAKLFTLMATAFVDMLGLLMIIPLLPFYVKTLGGSGVNVFGTHFGIGTIIGFIVASFTLAQLLSAPMWGRFSDRVGRRPTLLIALGASAIAYLIFGFAHSLLLLFLSRLVQGAGGGTVGVIQAYVADSTDPKDRARALGWLSATTNLGVALGPVLGSFAITLGKHDLMPGPGTTTNGSRGARESWQRRFAC